MSSITKLRNKDIIEWDVVNWSKALTFWEKYSKPITGGSKVLEIGSRNGGLSLYAALKRCQSSLF